MRRLPAASFLSLLLLLGVPQRSLAEEDFTDFVVMWEGEAAFLPSSMAVSRNRIVLAGSLSDGLEAEDASIIAFDSRTRSERWRFRWEDSSRRHVFRAEVAAAGRVCAAGPSPRDSASAGGLIVACLRAHTGRLLWRKEVSVERFSWLSLTLSGRTLVVHANVLPRTAFPGQPFVLSFDARDGGERVAAGQAEDSAAYVLEPEGEGDFLPNAATAFRATVFAAGAFSDDLLLPPAKAAIVAFDSRTRREIWRFERPDSSSRFQAVAAARGRVCAAGALETEAERNLIVACFRARTGRLLWQREVRGAADTILLNLSKRTLTVRQPNTVQFPGGFNPGLILSFDAGDGS